VAPTASAISFVESEVLENERLDSGETVLAVGDVNSDEHGVMVWIGGPNGPGRRSDYGDFGYGGVAVGDLNGDTILDVAYGIHHNWSDTDLGDQLIEAALGDGSGLTWWPWDDGLAEHGESWGMFGVALADFDHDGLLDLAANSFGCCAGLHVYRNHGDGSWSQSFGFVGGNSGLQLEAGDFDGNGHVDLAAARPGGMVFFGDGDGGFEAGNSGLPTVSAAVRVAVGDCDGDGADDLALTTGAGVAVFSYRSDQWQAIGPGLAVAGAVEQLDVADMDCDGYGDVVALSLDRVEIFSGGSGAWPLIATIDTPPVPGCAAVAAGYDLDHNGFPDIAIVHESGSSWFGAVNELHVYVEVSTAQEPSLHVVEPWAGQTLRPGTVAEIRWHAAVPAGGSLPGISLEISTNGMLGPFRIIATNVVNSGAYQWRVDPGTPGSARCVLRVSMASEPLAEAYSAPFAILNPDHPAGPVVRDLSR
jgi:hypothetical protein